MTAQITAYLYSLLIITSLVITFFSLLKAPKRIGTISFGVAVFGISFWILCVYFVCFSENPLMWTRLNFIGTGIMAAGLLFFILDYPKKLFSLSLIKSIVILIPPIIILFLAPTNFIVTSMTNLQDVKFNYGHKIFSLYFMIYTLAVVIIACVNAVRYKGINRQKLLYFLFGFSISLFLGSITNLFMPMFGNSNYVYLGPLFTYVLIYMTLWAIVKHDLLDIKVVISRLLAYGIVTFFIIASFIISNYFFITKNNLFFLGNIALCLFWAWFAHKIRSKIQTSVESKWITDWYDPAEIVNEISTQLSTLFNRKEIITSAVRMINQYLPVKDSLICIAEADHENIIVEYQLLSSVNNSTQIINAENQMIQLFLKEKQPLQYQQLSKEMKRYFSDLGLSKGCVFLPLHTQNSLEGIIILGKRSSELSYSEKDIKLFVTIVDIISVYLERMLPYERIKKEYTKTLEAAEKMSYQAALSSLNLGITHEINNPLMILQTETDVMLELLGDQKKSIITESLENVLGYQEQQIQDLINELKKRDYLDDNLEFTNDFIRNYVEKEIELAPSFNQIKEKVKSVLFSNYLSDAIINYFSVVNEVIERIMRITNTMLRHGVAESKDKEIVNLSNLMKDFQIMVESTCKKSGVQLDIKLGAEEFLIFCEKIRINQVFLNLARNAIQAMENIPENKDRILSFTTVKQSFINKFDKKVDGIEILVSDTGAGIAKENIRKIFDPFFTFGKQKSDGANTGLGLAIVIKIVEDHGGIINVESEINQGTSFRILLPLAKNK